MRERTRQIFSLLDDDAYDRRPIPLRHPIRFYEGHLASFARGQLLQAGSLPKDPQPTLTTLFARGIDPLDQTAAAAATIHQWPERAEVRDYIAAVDEEMEGAIKAGADPLHLHTALEHEEMHQETLIYLIHRLPDQMKRRPNNSTLSPNGATGTKQWIRVPAQKVQLGLRPAEAPFGWDNEFPATEVEVGAFEIESAKVTNGEFLEFVQAGGYTDERWWEPAAWQHVRTEEITAPGFWEKTGGEWMYRGLFEAVPLPPSLPVYVSHIEALAFTRWRGCRLPTEAEWHAAAALCSAPDARRDNFDFARWDLAPVPSEAGTPAQLAGNGWEWTSTPFSGFPGFRPFDHYPGYSADFFDDRHFVLKGASPVTPAALVRPSFRNWFQDQYRYAYTAFRCAR